MNGKKPVKATPLIDYVSAHIAVADYPVGARIPSVRRLAEKFQLSYGTAFRGIQYLVEQGLLHQEGRNGYVVSPSRPIPREYRRIAVFLEPFVTERGFGLCHTAFMQMQELAYRCGCHLFVVPVRGRDITTELLRRSSEGAHGIVLLNEYDAYFSQLDTDLPVVGTLINHSFGGRVSTVNLDPFQAAELAVEYFSRRRVRQVTISSAQVPVYRRRGEVFEYCWTRRGGSCKWNFDWHGALEPEPGGGIFFTSDQFAEVHIRETQEECGVDLTRKPIFSVDGKRLLAPSFHRFPTVAGNWAMIGQTLFWEIYNRITNPEYPVRHILLEGRLVMD